MVTTFLLLNTIFWWCLNYSHSATVCMIVILLQTRYGNDKNWLLEVSTLQTALAYMARLLCLLFWSNGFLALFLQEKKKNNLRDFLNVAGPMGVTHFLMLSKTQSAARLRVARTPQGPTLTFKINEYSSALDVAQSQLRPRCPQDLFKNSPLVIFYSHLHVRLWHNLTQKKRKLHLYFMMVIP